MIRRTFLFPLLLAVTATCQASFELLLVADNGTPTNPTPTRVIHRFDPSGVYLGSFGGFNSNIVGTHLNVATSSLFVITSNGTTEWNYNTGLLKASYNFASAHGSVVRPTQQTCAVFDGFSNFLLTQFPSAVGTTVSGSFSGAGFRAGYWVSNTQLYAYDAAGHRIVEYALNVAGTVANPVNAFGVPTGGVGFGQMGASGGTQKLVATSDSSTFAVFDRQTSTSTPITLSGGSRARSVASAHSGFFVGHSVDTSGGINYYDGNNNLVRTFGGQVINPVSMQTVLAPEPGSMAILGMGMIPLFLRRVKAKR